MSNSFTTAGVPIVFAGGDPTGARYFRGPDDCGGDDLDDARFEFGELSEQRVRRSTDGTVGREHKIG